MKAIAIMYEAIQGFVAMSIMMGFVFALIGLVYAQNLEACNAFLQSEFMEGMTKTCVYDHLGDDYYMSIRATSLCPLTVDVDHY